MFKSTVIFASLLLLFFLLRPTKCELDDDFWSELFKWRDHDIDDKVPKFTQKFVRLVDKRGSKDASPKNLTDGVIRLNELVAVVPSQVVEK